MKKIAAMLLVAGLLGSCSVDPDPVFNSPVISDIRVEASYVSAVVSFSVRGGDVSECGINYSLNEEGASVNRLSAVLDRGIATVSLDNLALESDYRFTPWAGNGTFEVKGEEQFFSTARLPEVDFWDITVLTEYRKATVNFVLSGKEFVRDVWISCFVSGKELIFHADISNDGTATATIDGLDSDTSYTFTIFAQCEFFLKSSAVQTFTTEPLPEVRVFDASILEVSASSIKVSFSFSGADMVTEAGCRFYPTKGGDAGIVKTKVGLSSSVSFVLDNLMVNTEYTIEPYVLANGETFKGTALTVSTFSNELDIKDVYFYVKEDEPHNIYLSFSYKYYGIFDSLVPYSLMGVYVQEGRKIKYDEDTFNFRAYFSGSTYLYEDSFHYMWPFAKSDTEYTIIPWVNISCNPVFHGSPVTIKTPPHTINSKCYEIDGTPWNPESNIPDPVLRKYVVENCDLDHDGFLSCDEANSVRRIECQNLGIKSLEGLNRFQNCKEMDCSYNPVSSIDLSYIVDKYGLLPSHLKRFKAIGMNDENGANMLQKATLVGYSKKNKLGESSYSLVFMWPGTDAREVQVNIPDACTITYASAIDLVRQD